MARAVPETLTLVDGDTTLSVSEDCVIHRNDYNYQSHLIIEAREPGSNRIVAALDEKQVKKLEARIRKFWRDIR